MNDNRIPERLWVNVYENAYIGAHPSKDDADAVAADNRLACVEYVRAEEKREPLYWVLRERLSDGSVYYYGYGEEYAAVQERVLATRFPSKRRAIKARVENVWRETFKPVPVYRKQKEV